MVKVKIAGREIPLIFDMDAWCAMEEEVCRLADIDSVLNADRKGEDGPKTSDSKAKFITLLRIMGNEGLEAQNEKGDLTDKWLRKNVRPAQYGELKIAAIQAIDEGMSMESEEQKKDEPRDLVLEEINKKKQQIHDPTAVL